MLNLREQIGLESLKQFGSLTRDMVGYLGRNMTHMKQRAFYCKANSTQATKVPYRSSKLDRTLL